MSSIGAHRVAPASHEDLDATVSVTRVLRRQFPHHRHSRRVALRQLRLVSQHPAEAHRRFRFTRILYQERDRTFSGILRTSTHNNVYCCRLRFNRPRNRVL